MRVELAQFTRFRSCPTRIRMKPVGCEPAPGRRNPTSRRILSQVIRTTMEGLPTASNTSAARPPGPKNTRPWLGVLPHFRKDPANYLLKTAREFGDLAYMRLGPQHAFVVSHPDAIRDVLVTNQGNFTKSR